MKMRLSPRVTMSTRFLLALRLTGSSSRRIIDRAIPSQLRLPNEVHHGNIYRHALLPHALARNPRVKAAVLFKANTPLEIVDLTQEGPRAGEARVKVKAAGICHSDWHIMNGDWTPPLPMVLGHEAAGMIEEVGPGVTNGKAGDHVIFSFRPHCGRCLYCSIGRTILCDGHTSARWGMLDGTYRLKNKGQDIYQMARIGTFSERVVCPAEMLVPIRHEMPWPQAALLGCCVPTGVGAVT